MPELIGLPEIVLQQTNVLSNNAKIQDVLSIRVVKGFLKNLENGRTNGFLFNPSEFEEAYEARYARHSSVGLSHQRMQFVGNTNARITMDLIFDEIVYRDQRKRGLRRVITGSGDASTRAQNDDVDSWRRRFFEFLYPRRTQRLSSAAPPAVLFHWPGIISMRVRVTSVRFRHVQFGVGVPLPRIMIASVELEEAPLERIYSEDAIFKGTIRPWAGRRI